MTEFALPEPEWFSFPDAVRLFVPSLAAAEVRAAILRAAEDGYRLVIRGAPYGLGRAWRDFGAEDNPLWSSGLLILTDRHGDLRPFEPEIHRNSLMSLFSVGADRQRNLAQGKQAVREPELLAFVQKTADGKMTELQVKDAAGKNFAGKRIPERRWRGVWARVLPTQKLQRGRPLNNPANKSGE